MSALLITDRIWEGRTWPMLARVTTSAAVAITIAGTSTITYKVIRISDQSVTGSGSLVVATSVYDTYQTDKGWDSFDSVGWNVRAVIPTAGFVVTTKQVRYRVEVLITLTTGEIVPLVGEVDVDPLMGS